MTTYSVTVLNNSQTSADFAVFQKPPPTSLPGNVFSLAWFARPTSSSSRDTFTWDLDYGLAWSETGVLQPGTGSAASQNSPADPNGPDVVYLTQDNFGAPTFSNPGNNGALGSLNVQQMANVAPNRAAVGIGTAGSGTFAEAASNMTTVFTPHPTYWVTSGNYTTGDVIHIVDGTSGVKISGGD